MPSLLIILVNYRSSEELRTCLKSLADAPSHNCSSEILVVNNDQESAVSPWLEREFPRVHLLQNPRNLGFSAAVNRGSRAYSSEAILLLNPDVMVLPGTLDRMMAALREYPRAGIIAPRLENPDGTLQYSCRRFYTPQTLLFRRFPFNRLFPNHPSVRSHLMLDWDHRELREVDWALGGALLVRREAMGTPPLFDPRFFLYFEDVDLCLRMKKNGWQVLYEPRAVMVHKHKRESAGRLFHPTKRHHLVSLIQFLRKHRFRLGG
jgi:GT2 family glycosyltransferase